MNQQQRAVWEKVVELLEDNREYIEANERAEYLAIYDKGIADANALLEQPEPVQEPLGFWQGEFKDGSAALYEVPQESLFGRKYPNIPVYTAAAQPEPVQEPVAKVCPDLPGSIGWNPRLTELPPEGAELFTEAQPAAWVGLTADEMLEALVSVDPATKRLPIGFARFAQAIEAKLREKNGGAV